MAEDTSWMHPLKEGRLQIGEGEGGEKAGSLVTGDQSTRVHGKGPAGSASGRELEISSFWAG